MLLKPLLSKRAKKASEITSSTTTYPSGSANNQTAAHGPDFEAGDGNFSHADAGKLVELLLEQSRRSKSGFFKAEKPRRPLKERRTLSENCLLRGIEAPSSTPDMLHLSRYPSTRSTGSTGSYIEIGHHTSKVSLAHSASTSAEVEPPVKAVSEVSQPPGKQPKPKNLDARPVDRSSIIPCLHRNISFQSGSNLLQAKVRKVASVFQTWTPSKRAKIRDGKQQAMEIEVVRPPTPPPKDFVDPSTSRQFEHLNLEGGKEAPGYVSEKDLDRLDEIDWEEAQKLKEVARLRREREMIQRRAEFENYKPESKNEKFAPKKDKGKKSSSLVTPGNLFNRGFAT
jgi:hypothetical protein